MTWSIDISKGFALVTGGVDVETLEKTYFPGMMGTPLHYDTWLFNIDTSVWNQGPSLQRSRFEHSCGLLVDSIAEGVSIAVVTGGRGHYSKGFSGFIEYPLRETELLVVQESIQNGQWFSGPELFEPIMDAFQITTSDKKQFIIGEGMARDDLDNAPYPSARLYRLQCFNLKCEWSRMKQILEQRRFLRAVAMLIPSNYNVKCSSTDP